MKTYRKCFEIFTIGMFLFYMIFNIGCVSSKDSKDKKMNDTIMVVDMIDTTTLEINIDTTEPEVPNYILPPMDTSNNSAKYPK